MRSRTAIASGMGALGLLAAPGLWRAIERRATCAVSLARRPTLCPQGNENWDRDELAAAVPDFARTYSLRPVQGNSHGINANHAFALWFTIRAIQPEYIIESGVLWGQSTWLIRQAAGPRAKIFALDPKSERLLQYRDRAGGAEYFMGPRFRDLGQLPWDGLIPMQERSRTLVVLDDHNSHLKRIRQLLESGGFTHVWVDDNNPIHYDAYYMQLMCSPLPPSVVNVTYRDAAGHVERVISRAEHRANLDFILEHVEVYFEFPTLFDGCGQSHLPQLLSQPTELEGLGLPPATDPAERFYNTAHPAYLRLKRKG